MAAVINQMNTGLFNLMIYASNSQRAEYFHEITNALINKFSCRVIFIELDETLKQERPEVTKCGNSEKCDQIRIRISNENLNHLQYLLYPILIPDLPVYLIWGECPTKENKILSELMKLSTRIIFDSECSENLKEFSRYILTKSDIENIDFMDIDWALIRGWREVLAQVFDSPERMEILSNCNSVKIYYNEIPSVFMKHFSTHAFYLQAWLAAQMEWRYLSQNKSKALIYKNGNIDVTLELIADHKANIAPGTLLKVVIQNDKNEEVVISKVEDQSLVLVHITHGDKCELPFSYRLPNFHRGLSFIKEIFYYRTSDQYKNMLQTIEKIDWKP